MFQSLLVAGALAGSLASALPSFGSLPEPNLFPRASCSGNTASTRSEWCDYSVDTDYGTETPDTGVTREYWLELTDVTVAPDGVSRSAMAVNGSIPGPTLFADWGDTVKVHVTNSLTTSNNGTSIHFHGIRQNYTNQNDGLHHPVPYRPGDTITYTWKATQYGSTWYHSHFALQAWQGIFGGIVINGPATANYDEDLGMLFLNDWDHQTRPPTLDNGLINGTNVYGDDDSTSQTGYRYNVTWDSGTSYRMRLVNAAVDTHWKFSIDNHTMQVIASDLVPITPTTPRSLTSAWDSVTTSSSPQTRPAQPTTSGSVPSLSLLALTTTAPTTSRASSLTLAPSPLRPLPATPTLTVTVSDANWDELESATVGKNTAGLFKWSLNSTSMLVDWANPTLESIVNGTTSWETDDAVIELSEANQWVYFVVETTLGVPHPIHLHGHDFFVLAQGSGTYSSSITLNTSNPPRRDTAMLPASGYLVMAWETDNPGAWLMHCHIGWHTSEGFSMQFIERYSEIAAITDNTTLTDTCSTWTTFQEENEIEQEDSGV
ncbi:LOW QUALITY PROTEIN: multicopper oxidase [Colletotrichum tofieldiae]|nr:LOW QUALITY PROTEIN: multicopper oxidase [Colletotrichum tofieldiae]